MTGRRPPGTRRAGNLNTIDEVPDSGWFTNRIGVRPMTTDELLRGPNLGPAPQPERWTIIREKSAGFAPGFTARDAEGETWFVSFDPPSNPEGATAAMVVASKIFWALGYNQVETFITTVRPDRRGHRSFRDGATSVRSAHSDHTTGSAASARARRPQRRRLVPGRGRPAAAAARSWAASSIRGHAPTIRTIWCRMSIGVSCGRSASSAPGRTSRT